MQKILFWDFDGTLVVPNEAYSIALDNALRAYGSEVPFDDIRRCTRVIPWHNDRTKYPHVTGERWWANLYGRIRPFTEAWGIPSDIHEKLCLRYREELRAYPYRLFDDALETLARCREMGYTCHLLSNNHPDLPLVLERMGLTGEFEKQFVGSLYGYDKPCAELYRYAMETAGEPDEVWMIGDNPHMDIKAAREAGLNTIWVGHRYAQEVGQRYADVTVDVLSEIPAALIRMDAEKAGYLIEDDCIGLRQYTHRDDRDMYRCWQDHDTQKGYNGIFDESFEQFSAFGIGRFPFWFTAVDKRTDTPVGTLRLGLDPDCPDLAIWIYPEYRKMGYGTKSFRMALEYIFTHTGYDQLSAGCFTDNTGSRKMLEKIGFVRLPAGDTEEPDMDTGEPILMMEYRIARETIL